MVDEIVKAQGRLGEVMEREPDKNFSDYQTQTFQNAKTVAKHAQEMALQGANAPETLSAISRSLTTAYGQLVDSSRGALATIEGEEVAMAIIISQINHL